MQFYRRTGSTNPAWPTVNYDYSSEISCCLHTPGRAGVVSGITHVNVTDSEDAGHHGGFFQDVAHGLNTRQAVFLIQNSFNKMNLIIEENTLR